MSEKTMPCPDCRETMHYRLGEFECDGCGRRMAASSMPDDDKLPVRKSSEPVPAGYRPGTSGYVDGSISRGTRQR